MIRVVLDTNVLVSALLHRGGTPGRIVSAWESGDFVVCSSPPLVQELAAVLARREVAALACLTADQMREFVQLIAETSILVMKPPDLRGSVPEDPADDAVLAAAIGARADVIVSGDSHLLKLKEFRGIPILTPRQFLDLLSQ